MMKSAKLCLAIFFALCASLHAQEAYRANWFKFVVPDLASSETANSPIDLSFLNPEPAGANGYLRPDGERIVDGNGNEVLLFGSNICDYHPMPPKELSPKIAKRLKELGFNFIRLHYFDFAAAPKGILNDDMQTLNPEKLDQFDWLVANLKENGIYVDINLHICRPYKNQPKEIHRFGKGIDFVHDPYIESQKQYARDLIGHVNPYTKLSYAEDPAVAVIEINNENTVMKIWSLLANLGDEFTVPLRKKWNAWLRKKYGNTEGLKAAWDQGASGENGPELLPNGSFENGKESWTFEHHKPGEGTATILDDTEVGKFLRWNITRKGTASWHMQFYATDLAVENGKTYAISFKARSGDGKKAILSVYAMMQQAPWGNVGGEVAVSLGKKWREFGLTCRVSNPNNIPIRLNFTSKNKPGIFDIADISVREGVFATVGTQKGESLENDTVPLVADTACIKRSEDYMAFLMDAEADYVNSIKDVLQKELGSKAMIFCSQASYGGLAGLKREAQLGDIVDMHCYPCHPHNEANAEGKTVRVVNNESMISKAFGGIERASLWRVKGMPFMMTEFDINPPNDHASENFSMLALISAYQGWSGFAEYSWYNFQGGKHGHSRILSNFATTGHAGQISMVPSMALLYRQRLVKPASDEVLLTCPESEISARIASNAWYGIPNLFGEQKGDTSDVWRKKVACTITESGTPSLTGSTGKDDKKIVSDTGEILFDRTQADAESLQVNAPAARMLTGYVGGREFKLGDVTLKVEKGTFRNYANISLVAMDNLPIAKSKKVLLTTIARVENTGQKWNEERNSIGTDWGEGPTLAEPVPVSLTLPGTGWKARTLDGNGQPTGNIEMENSTLTSDKAVWYLIER